jgi:hypothetical protein
MVSDENKAELPNLHTDEDVHRLLASALVGAAPGGVSPEDVEKIVEDHHRHLFEDAMWRLVMDGRLLVSWKDGETNFKTATPEETARVAEIAAAARQE